jgi:hypothetical protein
MRIKRRRTVHRFAPRNLLPERDSSPVLLAGDTDDDPAAFLESESDGVLEPRLLKSDAGSAGDSKDPVGFTELFNLLNSPLNLGCLSLFFSDASSDSDCLALDDGDLRIVNEGRLVFLEVSRVGDSTVLVPVG